VQPGAVQRGRVTTLTANGAFVTLGGGHLGLLHKSELAHEFVDDPARLLTVGDEVEVAVLQVQRKDRGGRLTISLSRKALLPPPAPPAPAPGDKRRDDRRGGRAEERKPAAKSQEKFLVGGTVSLGEMLLAKLREQEKKG
jgi:small subunit ribosomal protein S1